MKQNTTTIRMSASEWSVTVGTEKGPLKFNLREMSRQERGKFHAAFMGAYRLKNPYQPRKVA
jgi:hypothetical protein